MVAVVPKATSPLERVLTLLNDVKPAGRSYSALCPAHPDRDPSLSVWEDESDGHVGFKCWSHGCETQAICAALGIEQTELYRGARGRRTRGPARTLDLLDLACAKLIHPRLLTSWGVTDGHTWTHGGHRTPGTVRIPYLLADGTEHTLVRIRINLTAKQGSRWEGTGKTLPYGLSKLAEAREAGYVWVVEGESDAWTLWSRKLPALGIPGASNTQALQPGVLDGVAHVYIVSEPDQAGEQFPARVVKRLRETGYAGECYSVCLQTLFEVKDPNDLLHKLAREKRMGEFSPCMQQAREAAQLIETSVAAEPDEQAIVAELDQAIKDALEAQDANALYALVDRLARLKKADQARLKVLIHDGTKRCPGFSQRDFNSLLRDAQAQQTRQQADERVYVSGRPQITLGRQLLDEANSCFDALYAANAQAPRIFIREGKLVRIVQDEKHRAHIEHITIDSMTARLTEVADFVSYNQERDTFSSQHPPADVVRNILSRSDMWKFPALEGITEIPVLRADGSILDKPGYDESTKLYFLPAPELTLPKIPANPTRLQVMRARDFVFSFFAQFAYASQSDRANAYGIILALVMMEIARPALAPLITAAKRGEGKTLFADALATIATGSPAHTTTLPTDDAELKKELLGRLADGETFISFDNVTGTVTSRNLDSFLTGNNWGGRLLGSNTNLAVEKNRVLTLLNGNNVLLGGDLPRRVLPIRLASGFSHPWERPITYRFSPLLEHVKHHRGEIIAALLTMARAWHLAGRPLAAIRDESGFGPWKRTIGGFLAYLEIDGFLGNLEELENAAPEDTQWLRFLQTWYETTEEALTVKEIFALLEASEELRDALPDRLAKYFSAEDTKRQNPRSFGYALGQKRETPYGVQNLKLAKGPKDKHRQQDTWLIVASPMPIPPDGEPPQGDCGIDSSTCGIDCPENNQSRNQSCRPETAPEANGDGIAGLCGIDLGSLVKEEKIFFSQDKKKEKEKIFFDIGSDPEQSIPQRPVNGSEAALQAGLDVQDRSFSAQSIPQGEESIPQADTDTALLAQVRRNVAQRCFWHVPASVFGNGFVDPDVYIERLRQLLASGDTRRRQAALDEIASRQSGRLRS